MNVKIITNAEKNYNWNPNTCICENTKYSKYIPDTSVIMCYEIISAMDIVTTKLKNAITKKFWILLQ